MGPKGRLLSWTFCVLIPLVPGGLLGPGQSASSLNWAEGTSSPAVAALPAGISTDWWSRAQNDLAGREYHASVAGGRLQAPNRAQNLRTTFEPRGLSIVPRTKDSPASAWRFEWHTVGFGREGSVRRVAPAEPVADGARVEYRRDELVEWYENRTEGIEQGFTLPTRPAGEGKVVVTGGIPAELEAQLSADGQEINFLNRDGARVLRYGDLHVYDACGQELPSRLAIEKGKVAILIDDRRATYPITIDPLMTSPAWVAEGNQASAFFGISVATAGDVNGDGFSDVIIGAHSYDNGESDEGRAFVYHGTSSGIAISPAWIAECNQEFAYFGESAATAGDVNGDGYSDVIVGARFYTSGQANEGRAFVYQGSAAGLMPTPAWIMESNQAFAWFGISVATAGDVNRDGYSDVIIGAYEYDNGQSNEGRAWVYHGSTSGLASAPSWSAESNQVGAGFGLSVATAGDVNGDGYSDVIVGAYRYDNVESDEGRVFAYHGSASGLAATPAWTVESNQGDAQLGSSVATAGDVNGDGYTDVIVGAHKYDNGQIDEGRALVYHGSGTGLRLTPAWSYESNEAGAFFGYSVATAGDVNGDGFSDVIVGAIQEDTVYPDEGSAYFFQGSAAGLSAVWHWSARGDQVGALFGCSVATAGDVNGDGFSDVLVGAYLYDSGQTNEGRAFSYHGSASGLANWPLWTAESNQQGAQLGTSVASGGDVNGDGYSDVIVGVPNFDNGQFDEGRVYFYPGSGSGISLSPTWTAEGNQIDTSFGSSVATAGDVNGDGYSDIIIGAPTYGSNQSLEGRAFVYHGSASGPVFSPTWIGGANQAAAYFGRSVATAGDVNGDGYSDIIVGAELYDNDQDDEGRTFVYYGAATGLPQSPVWIGESDQTSSYFGHSVGTAGDVNGDGYSDIIVGAPSYDNGQVYEGRAFLYLGSEQGLTTTPDWIAESDQAFAALGGSVSNAGDVNGDGYSDVIVGASNYTNIQTNEGRALVFYGSISGLSLSPDWTAESNQNNSNFGHSVATAGDVNGDGFSDILVGAPALGGHGSVFAYHGSLTGPMLPWIVNGLQDGALFGWSVATAGDVNGDGYSDVIVGAPRHSKSQLDEGRAVIYLGNDSDGLDRLPAQARTDDAAPIDLLCRSDSETAFRLKALGRTPAGRGKVRLQLEVKPFGTAFDGSGLVTGSASDTGNPGNGGSAVMLSQLASGLVPETLYHWRWRILTDSPFFPRSRWLWLPGNGVTEADVRTASGSTSVSDQLAPLSPFRLGPSSPNPFDTRTEISYTLAHGGRLRLSVYDVMGREMAVLADGVRPAGRHQTRWDGRSAAGTSLPAGVYFLRLDVDGKEVSQKIVITR